MSLKYTTVLPIQLTPPTPMTPASSASSTSQQMEKYKNARNKSPVRPAAAAAAATTVSSGKLRRYEGYEKDLHKILNKASAKRTTAPLQPVKYALSYKK